MANKFDRFDEDAQEVLSLAQEEARSLNHGYVGTEHLLLGLVGQKRGIAANVLRNLGIQLDAVRQIVEVMIGRGKRPISRSLGLTPGVKRVVELALAEVKKHNVNRVRTEHLLLGLAQEGNGVASGIFDRLNVSLDTVYENTIQMIGQPPPKPFRAPPPKSTAAQTQLIEQLGTDLTAQAEQGHLDPVIGRDEEVEFMIQTLSRRTKNNPALIGEPGVGKTAIVEGLAQRLADDDVPAPLRHKKLWALQISSLVAGTSFRGQFEERLKRIMEEAKASESILFIDEIHMIVGAGATEGAMDAANILKPALSRGDLSVIGATTVDEYRKYIETDAALERRFQPIMVDEPTIEETVQILSGLRDKYESHHNLRISDEALQAAAYLSMRYIPDRYLPDKAIDLMDEAASRVWIHKHRKASALRKQMLAEQQIVDHLYLELWDEEGPVVTREDIAEIVSLRTGIPMNHITQTNNERLIDMENKLHQRVIGQHEAVVAVSKAVRRTHAGLKNPQRPIGSFMFLGPSGVGKSELAKALSEFLMGSESALIKIDMSEFMERHAISRLVGAPPGYIGHEEGGELTEAIRRRPYSVVLFDEIEKAHPEVFNLLLQVLEEGSLTDSKGRRVDFRNTLILMTANIEVDSFNEQAVLGFKQKWSPDVAQTKYEQLKAKSLKRLKNHFRPEFLNRLDDVIVFEPLKREDIQQIVGLLLQDLQVLLDEQKIALEVTETGKRILAEKGYDPQYGARLLKRTIQELVIDAISEGLINGTFKQGDNILINGNEEENDVVFTTPPINQNQRSLVHV